MGEEPIRERIAQLIVLATIYHKKGKKDDLKKASKLFNQAAKLAKKHKHYDLMIHGMIGASQIGVSKEKIKKSIEEHKNFFGQYKMDYDTCALVHKSLAALYMKIGREKEAEEHKKISDMFAGKKSKPSLTLPKQPLVFTKRLYRLPHKHKRKR
jgi:FKBP-type peptidyl-prolyl cis-trans isomerase (trigger factor)